MLMVSGRVLKLISSCRAETWFGVLHRGLAFICSQTEAMRRDTSSASRCAFNPSLQLLCLLTIAACSRAFWLFGEH